MLAKLAKQAYNDNPEYSDYQYLGVRYHGYYMHCHEDNYWITGWYGCYNWSYSFEESFDVAKGKIIEIAQTTDGYKVKLTYQDETLELTVNPFK